MDSALQINLQSNGAQFAANSVLSPATANDSMAKATVHDQTSDNRDQQPDN